MSSRGTTSLLSLGQMYCCFNRDEHLACKRLKEIPAEELPAEYSLTGIETSPNETVPVAIGRALIGLGRIAQVSVHGAPAGPWGPAAGGFRPRRSLRDRRRDFPSHF